MDGLKMPINRTASVTLEIPQSRIKHQLYYHHTKLQCQIRVQVRLEYYLVLKVHI